MTKRQLLGRAVIGVLALFVLIQFVPYGHSHSNPPVTQAVRWDSPQTATLFAGACQDCHSNLSNWRWYDKVAPGSWLVNNDIQGGRDHLNVSTWDKPQPDLREVLRVIRSGAMPPLQYKVAHASGRLTKSQRDALARGFAATYKKDPPRGGAYDR
jgi:mono/diheme cytochrome c family protein